MTGFKRLLFPDNFELDNNSHHAKGLMGWWPGVENGAIRTWKNYVQGGAPARFSDSGTPGTPTYEINEYGQRAVNFGASYYLADLPYVPNTAFTIACRLRVSALNLGGVWGIGDAVNNQGAFFSRSNTADDWKFTCWGFGFTAFQIGSVGDIVDVVGTFDGSNARAYVDGVLTNTQASLTFNTPTNSRIVFGNHVAIPDIRSYDDLIWDFRLFNRVLSDAEILAYTHDPLCIVKPKIAFWPKRSPGGVVSLSPGVGARTIAGQAPTVAAAASIATSAGARTIAGQAPTWSAAASLTPNTGARTILGQAPTVTIGGAVSLTPGSGTVTITGQAPSVTAAAALTPSVGSKTIVGFAPTVGIGLLTVESTPGAGAMTTVGFAPLAETHAVFVPLTKTAMARKVLGYLGLVSEQTAENAWDIARAEEGVCDCYAELSEQGLIWWPVEAVPLAAAEPFCVYVAAEIADIFMDEDRAIVFIEQMDEAYRRIAKSAHQRKTSGRSNDAEYF